MHCSWKDLILLRVRINQIFEGRNHTIGQFHLRSRVLNLLKQRLILLVLTGLLDELVDLVCRIDGGLGLQEFCFGGVGGDFQAGCDFFEFLDLLGNALGVLHDVEKRSGPWKGIYWGCCWDLWLLNWRRRCMCLVLLS